MKKSIYHNLILNIMAVMTILFMIACEKPEVKQNQIVKKVKAFKENTFTITPLKFSSDENIELLKHANIYYPLKFKCEYNTNKLRFHLWAEIWRGNQLTTKTLSNLGGHNLYENERKGTPIGKGSFEVEISENHQMLKDFNKVAVNVFVKKDSRVIQSTSIEIDDFPRGGVHHLMQNVYTNPNDFYFTYACYGYGACTSIDREFPHDINISTRSGEECTIIFRGQFTNSDEDFIAALRKKYEKYRPVISDYNLKLEN